MSVCERTYGEEEVASFQDDVCPVRCFAGPGLPKRPPFAPAVDEASITSSTLSVTWSSWAEAEDEDAKKGADYQRLLLSLPVVVVT